MKKIKFDWLIFLCSIRYAKIYAAINSIGFRNLFYGHSNPQGVSAINRKRFSWREHNRCKFLASEWFSFECNYQWTALTHWYQIALSGAAAVTIPDESLSSCDVIISITARNVAPPAQRYVYVTWLFSF